MCGCGLFDSQVPSKATHSVSYCLKAKEKEVSVKIKATELFTRYYIIKNSWPSSKLADCEPVQNAVMIPVPLGHPRARDSSRPASTLHPPCTVTPPRRQQRGQAQTSPGLFRGNWGTGRGGSSIRSHPRALRQSLIAQRPLPLSF